MSKATKANRKRIGFLAVDEYGRCLRLNRPNFPRKQLLTMLCATSCRKMYVDTTTGKTLHIGYVVNGSWWTLYEVFTWEGKVD